MLETSWARAILHVDMDAFFAAVEVLDNPLLRGKPVIVGGTPQGHGVVSTASYEARRFGVRSAMPAATAVRLCPGGIFLRPRLHRYSEVSRAVMAVLGEHSPLVEALSIDEAFVDITGSQRLQGSPRSIASAIKRRIREATGGLTASVGLAACKFLAKVASDHGKPDGLTVVEPSGALAFLAPLPIETIWGVGPKTAESLRRAGISTIRDLQSREEISLKTSFGEDFGGHLFRLSRGIDDRQVSADGRRRSVSSETTLEQFIQPDDLERVKAVLLRLSDDVAASLRRERLLGRTVTLKVRNDQFVTRTRAATLTEPAQLTDDIYGAALRLFQEKLDLGGRRIRLLGISASRLQEGGIQQLDLLESPRRDKALRLAEAVDAIRDRLGAGAILRGRNVRSRKAPGRTIPPRAQPNPG